MCWSTGLGLQNCICMQLCYPSFLECRGKMYEVVGNVWGKFLCLINNWGTDMGMNLTLLCRCLCFHINGKSKVKESFIVMEAEDGNAMQSVTLALFTIPFQLLKLEYNVAGGLHTYFNKWSTYAVAIRHRTRFNTCFYSCGTYCIPLPLGRVDKK